MMCQAAPTCQPFPVLQDRYDPNPHRIHHQTSEDTPRWAQTAANTNTSCLPAPTHLRFSMGPPFPPGPGGSGLFPCWTSPFLVSLLGLSLGLPKALPLMLGALSSPSHQLS